MIVKNRIHLVCLSLSMAFLSLNAIAQNVALDKKMGKENAEQVASEMGIYQQKEITEYFTSIGKNLEKNINGKLFDYKFSVVEMLEPNAFALPGGYLFISRTLLCLANSEDEIAGVLGHEIIHSELRHSVKQMKKSIFPSLLQVPGALVGVVVSEDLGNLINTPINAGSELFMANYSRKHEKEADKYGLQLMAKTGYDPTQFPLVLHNLEALIELYTGKKEKFSYYDSHPYTPKRIEDLNKEITQLSYPRKPGVAKNHKDFLSKLDGVCFMENPAMGVFKDNNFLHPDLDLFMTFPKGWATENKPTAVGAVDTTDNKSMVVLAMAPKNIAPDSLGIQFIKKLKEKNKFTPTRAESVELNGMPAYIVSINDSTGSEVMGIHSLWFRFNNITYQMLGVAKADKLELLKETAMSVRSLTSEERNSIDMLTLRIREAKKGESIEQFSKRTGNEWKPEMTAVMNNIEPNSTLTEGQLIKIVLKEKYLK